MTTLAFPYGFGVETLDIQRGYASTAAMGAVLRRRVSERKVRRWRIQWDLAPKGVYELVREAWDANGEVAPMDWTDPDGNALRVRFASRPQTNLASYTHAALSIELEEVL